MFKDYVCKYTVYKDNGQKVWAFDQRLALRFVTVGLGTLPYLFDNPINAQELAEKIDGYVEIVINPTWINDVENSV